MSYSQSFPLLLCKLVAPWGSPHSPHPALRMGRVRRALSTHISSHSNTELHHHKCSSPSCSWTGALPAHRIKITNKEKNPSFKASRKCQDPSTKAFLKYFPGVLEIRNLAKNLGRMGHPANPALLKESSQKLFHWEAWLLWDFGLPRLWGI